MSWCQQGTRRGAGELPLIKGPTCAHERSQKSTSHSTSAQAHRHKHNTSAQAQAHPHTAQHTLAHATALHPLLAPKGRQCSVDPHANSRSQLQPRQQLAADAIRVYIADPSLSLRDRECWNGFDMIQSQVSSSLSLSHFQVKSSDSERLDKF